VFRAYLPVQSSKVAQMFSSILTANFFVFVFDFVLFCIMHSHSKAHHGVAVKLATGCSPFELRLLHSHVKVAYSKPVTPNFSN
jgi:hypothetical protein